VQSSVASRKRFEWGQPEIPGTSVPFFDPRCGLRFRDGEEFPERLDEFLQRLSGCDFSPRQYVLENLTLERCSANYVAIVDDATGRRAA